MANRDKICKKCGHVIEDKDAKDCAICGGTKFTTFWQGYTIILNPEKSDVAKILGIEHIGKFALRIN